MIIFGLCLAGLVVYICIIAWIDPLKHMLWPLWYHTEPDFAESNYKKYKRHTWLPLCLCLAMLMAGIAFVIYDKITGYPVLSDIIANTLIITSFVLMVPVTIVCKKVSSEITRRYNETMSSPHCFRCGYNLAGNPDVRHCPECGASTAPDENSFW